VTEAGEKGYSNVARTELVWPGKRTQIERVALPFQVVETVNQSRATREQTPLLAGLPAPPLFESQTQAGSARKNMLIWGDNKYVMASLLQGDPSIGLEPLAGKIDLIYIDPPFATGQDFSYRARVGDAEWIKEASIIEETAYRDTWGRGVDSYLQMMYERLVLTRELLSERAALFVHLDVHHGPYVRLVLDEVFGRDNFQNEIAWYYYNKLHGQTKRCLPKAFDAILYYVKDKRSPYSYHTLSEPRDKPVKKLKYRFVDGKIENIKDEDGKTITYESTERQIDNVWRIRCLQPANIEEWVDFDTQKPVDLIERVLDVASNEGDLVFDAFCGSGTSLVACERLGRRWIGCDLSRYAIEVTRKRLLGIPHCRPFQVMNLGKYERKHWQVNILNGRQEDGSKAITDYLRFIVALYNGKPVGGYRHLHGQKAGRWVHVGAADAPVTRSEIMDAVRECQANRYTALDVLGWEWEMGLHDTVRDEAKRMGVDLRLLYIPREVMDKRAVEAGDVHFYELAYLKPSLLQDKRTVTVRLDDFIIPNPDLVPDEVRSKIKKWSDYIDFWAVDWNYQGDTFHNEWQTYRTRKNPTLRLVSDPHPYDKAGSYRILVKVIDIFGNDTTQLLEADV